MLRTIAAFFIAPVPVAIFQSLLVSIWPKIGKGAFEHPASMFVVICLYFYLFGLVLGLPAWLVFHKRSSSLTKPVLIGLFSGLGPVALAMLVMASRGQGSAYIYVYNLAVFGTGGMVAGALFWIVRQRRTCGDDVTPVFR